MTDGVKPRPYRSNLRAEQAQETRRRIRAAADGLFLAQGYSDVSMDDIARAAGVARQTVFTAFGSKAKVMKEVIDVRLAGDDAPLALVERPAAQRLFASTDPAEAIRQGAWLIVDVALRVAPVWPAVRQAGAVDREIADLLRAYDGTRREGVGRIVDVVAGLGALRKGRTRAKAKDAVFILTDPGIVDYAHNLSWSRRELERWYVDCLTALLLD